MLSLDRPLVILDLEATGTDPQKARIIQVAAKRLVPEQHGDIRIAAALTEVVNPGIPVDDRILDLTGITQSELDNGSPWPTVADRLGALIEDADLAGYNIQSYDLPLLEVGLELDPTNRDMELILYRLSKRLQSFAVRRCFLRLPLLNGFGEIALLEVVVTL